MGNLEVCLGHVTHACSECRADDRNSKCPHYHPISIKVFEVRDVEEAVQDDYSNQA